MDLDDEDNSTLTEHDINEIKQSMDIVFKDILDNISRIDYHLYEFDKNVKNSIYDNFSHILNDEQFDNIYDNYYQDLYYNNGIVSRHYDDLCIITEINNNIDYTKYENQVKYLMEIEQPEQRTQEWYEFRYNHITGSNAWKLYTTESAKKQLYYEKLAPFTVDTTKRTNTSDNPLNWGHKYEPITTMLYEYKNKVKIGEFGCIPHKNIPFLAASPDGIVISEHMKGRMLEIKNVVSREITGTPKMEYYIQMQIQMEVCDLDECDFVETKFLEYDSYYDFMNDKTRHNDDKGMIVVILENNNNFIYEYSNIGENSEKQLDLFIDSVYEKYNISGDMNSSCGSHKWFKNIYWKLEKYSSVLVQRNKDWFNEAYPNMKEFWNNIMDERKVPESHIKYQPKKRIPKTQNNEKTETNINVVKINNFMTENNDVVDLNNL